MNPFSPFDPHTDLYPLRKKIIDLMCKGWRVKKIAEELDIKHTKTIYRIWTMYADESERALRERNLK